MKKPFSKYLDPNLVSFSHLESRDEIILELVKIAKKAKKVDSTNTFFEAVMNREKVVTTGIGMGVAIPHAKTVQCDDFFIAVSVLEKGVNWNSLDGSPVRLVFLIGGPDNRQTEYLQLLSALTHSLKDESVRKQLLNSSTPEEVCHLLE